jgi:predicted CopG family antitoxin
MTKVITLSDESYKELKKWKGKKSFSETILQLTSAKGRKQSLLDVIQSMGDASELADALEKVYVGRAHQKLRRYS